MQITSLIPLALIGLTAATPVHNSLPLLNLDETYSDLTSKTQELQAKIEALPLSPIKINLQQKVYPIVQKLTDHAKHKNLVAVLVDALALVAITKDKQLLYQLSHGEQPDQASPLQHLADDRTSSAPPLSYSSIFFRLSAAGVPACRVVRSALFLKSTLARKSLVPALGILGVSAERKTVLAR
ncbi:hypothetical protein L249_4786 [Ophiocordyceps polyrhachis-furcata BCC 54312]|uniref:Cell wall protein n=1 Tax=Ophiocordyceps polyrhachis-furcata BCC 54312 TaxID=1330021 RepID=A0A367L2Y2_9HYPO|nr:hypothetical protein L249_4786 [Ophiocordyceps polyrhachis-furcata BCC 54312]